MTSCQKVGRAPSKPPRKAKANASSVPGTGTVTAPSGAPTGTLHGAMGGPVPASSDGSSIEARTCPTGCGYVSASQGGLTDHAKRQHGKSLPELRGAPLAYNCPECEDRFTSPQGLGAHRKAIHGVEGSSKAAVAARSSAGS